MTLPASGAISFNAINVELGVAGTTQANINQASYRTLAGVPSGQISLSNFYGKSNEFAFTISSNQTNANLRTLAVAAGWPGTAKVVATINGGVYVSSNSTGTPGLTVNGSFPGGVSLINNGFIIGMGGNGGEGGGAYFDICSGASAAFQGPAPTAGGGAMLVSVALTVNNAGTIGGGGGAGGGGGSGITINTALWGGGGGGGRTGSTNSSGGARGSLDNGGTVWAMYQGTAGTSGTSSVEGSAGAGGSGGGRSGGAGGAGGTWGASGATGSNVTGTISQTAAGRAGSAAGYAVSGNSNITWVATGTRLGSIS